MSVCLSVCLRLSIFFPAACPCDHLPVCLTSNLSQPVCLPGCLSVCLRSCPSVPFQISPTVCVSLSRLLCCGAVCGSVVVLLWFPDCNRVCVPTPLWRCAAAPSPPAAPGLGEGSAWNPASLDVALGDMVAWLWEAPLFQPKSYRVFSVSSPGATEYDGGAFSSGETPTPKGTADPPPSTVTHTDTGLSQPKHSLHPYLRHHHNNHQRLSNI